MLICDRIRAIREAKKLSQGDIEKRSGLLRPYLLRIENGHTVPSVETLEKLARALEVPLYQLFLQRRRTAQGGLSRAKMLCGQKYTSPSTSQRMIAGVGFERENLQGNCWSAEAGHLQLWANL